MASPQKENGYTPIANEILNHIMRVKLNGTQFRIVIAVWRYTYGFSRKEANLSDSYLAKAIGIARHNLNREIKPLFDKKILFVNRGSADRTPSVISFNKNYDEWEVVSNPITGIESDTGIENDSSTGIESDTKTGIESDTQDKQYIKQNIKQRASAFFDTAWRLYPKKKGKGKISNTQKEKIFILDDRFISAIHRYVEEIERNGTQMQYIMYGSTFFNSGYVDYLDENYSTGTTLTAKPEISPEEREDY